MARETTQQSQRRDIRPVDQFGRKYFASIEIATGGVTGQITKTFVDPLNTPQKFLEMPGDENGDSQLNRLVVNFERWKSEIVQDEGQWYQTLLNIAGQKYSRLDPNDVPHLENDPFIRGLAGPKPWPSSLVIDAAAAGDRQYLGFEKLDTEHRKALGLPYIDGPTLAAHAAATVPTATADSASIPPPPDTYQEFLTWAFKYNGARNLTDGAAQWNEHKRKFQETVTT